MIRLVAAIVVVQFMTATANWVDAAESKSAFPPALELKGAINKSRPAPSSGFGYVSGSAGGAFTLNGREGHASFRWNHGLDVDWHDHPTQYAGTAQDADNNYYWVYSLKYQHEGHIDKVWIFFAEQTVPTDTGFRIFFGHADFQESQPEPEKPEDHDIHIWCVDAVQLRNSQRRDRRSEARK